MSALINIDISTLSSIINIIKTYMGERAAGLGGAYTALANDSTSVYYNPAGLADINSLNVNISANTVRCIADVCMHHLIERLYVK